MSKAQEYGFGSETFDWDKYQLYRPKYPASVMKRIFEYHELHHDEYRVAHDMGTGHGIIASMLANRFDNVRCSDPNAYNLRTAEKNLLSLNHPPGKFCFAADAMEDMSGNSGGADLMTIFEAIHWTSNIDRAIEAVATNLKPNGTLAMLYYNPRPFFVDNPRAEAASGNIFDAFELHVTNARSVAAMTAVPQGNMGLDFVPLPPKLFKSGSQRIYINTDQAGQFPFQKSSRWSNRAHSRVEPSENIIHIEDEDWSQIVDADWLGGLVDSLQQGLSLDSLKEDFDEFKVAIESNGGRAKIFWRVNLVLATRS